MTTAPGVRTERDTLFAEDLRQLTTAGESISPYLATYNGELAAQAVPEWQATLYAAFGSREKTLHANPDRHAEVPAFELDGSQRFFLRHLVHAASPAR